MLRIRVTSPQGEETVIDRIDYDVIIGEDLTSLVALEDGCSQGLILEKSNGIMA